MAKITHTNYLDVVDNVFSAAKNKGIMHINSEEKSFDGKEFSPIGKTAGAGNSTLTLNYNFDDTHPVFGISYYRLKQTDFDGAFSYSQTVPVKYNASSKAIPATAAPTKFETRNSSVPKCLAMAYCCPRIASASSTRPSAIAIRQRKLWFLANSRID